MSREIQFKIHLGKLGCKPNLTNAVIEPNTATQVSGEENLQANLLHFLQNAQFALKLLWTAFI
ncbi:hypothetical protein ACWATR_10515 [Nostoc sp. UIC 10890]